MQSPIPGFTFEGKASKLFFDQGSKYLEKVIKFRLSKTDLRPKLTFGFLSCLISFHTSNQDKGSHPFILSNPNRDKV